MSEARIKIAAAVDDGTWDLFFTDIGRLVLTVSGPNRQNFWVRFIVPIEPGVKINSAFVRLQLAENPTGAGNVDSIISLDQEDDAPNPTDSADALTRRNTGAPSVVWIETPAGKVDNDFHDAPDITVKVQQILDRPGWSSRNHMTIYFFAQTGQQDTFIYKSFDTEGGGAEGAGTPELIITFTPLTLPKQTQAMVIG